MTHSDKMHIRNFWLIASLISRSYLHIRNVIKCLNIWFILKIKNYMRLSSLDRSISGVDLNCIICIMLYTYEILQNYGLYSSLKKKIFDVPIFFADQIFLFLPVIVSQNLCKIDLFRSLSFYYSSYFRKRKEHWGSDRKFFSGSRN